MTDSPPLWAVEGSKRFQKLDDYVPLLRPYAATKKVTPRFQAFQIKEMLEGPRDELVCISGTKTEAVPFFFMCSLMRKMQKKGYQNFTWVSMRHTNMGIFNDDSLFLSAKHAAFVFTNVLPDSSQYRIEKLKDALDIAGQKGIMRIVLVGGSDPYKFCVERLRLAPTCGIYLESNS